MVNRCFSLRVFRVCNIALQMFTKKTQIIWQERFAASPNARMLFWGNLLARLTAFTASQTFISA